MITTLCLNPSFDRTVELASLRLGETNRALSARTDAGGKGLNVALTLGRLGAPARCAGLAGAEDIERLRAMCADLGAETDWQAVPGAVRTNIKLRDLAAGTGTEISEAGPTVDEETAEAFFAAREGELRRSDFVVFTGSVPPGCPPTVYADWMRRLGETPCVLDASGEALEKGLAEKPFLVKPNLEEIAQLCGLARGQWGDLAAVAAAGREVLARGARRAIVSMGGDGALLVTEAETLFAPALQVEVRSAVGAGDAMLAGFLAGFLRTRNDAEAFRWSVAAATASVTQEGTQPLRYADFERLLGSVRLRRLA